MEVPKTDSIQAAVHALERFTEQTRQPQAEKTIQAIISDLPSASPPTKHHRHSSSTTSITSSPPTDSRPPATGPAPTRATPPAQETMQTSDPVADQDINKPSVNGATATKSIKARGLRKDRKSSSTSSTSLTLDQQQQSSVESINLPTTPNDHNEAVAEDDANRPNLNLDTTLTSHNSRGDGLETIYSGTTVASTPGMSMPRRQSTMRSDLVHRRNSSLTSSSAIHHLPTSSLITYDPTLDPGTPLSVIAKKFGDLPGEEQVPIRRTLELISARFNFVNQNHDDLGSTNEDQKLPLDERWTLFFSDTSSTSTSKTPLSSSRHGHGHGHGQTSLLKAAEYQSGMSEVFSDIGDVESLCTCLINFKKSVAERLSFTPISNSSSSGRGHSSHNNNSNNSNLEVPGNGLGLISMKPQQNLHFFRVGVNPVWEDPWNSKGGRLTISTTLAMLDPIFENLVLLIAGGVIESDAGKGGRVVGIVGSRRNRGDRIEIWLSGDRIGIPPDENWVRRVQEVVVREINTLDVRKAKYKSHLSH